MTFANSPILNLNKFENDFYFLRFQNNDEEEFFFKYDSIFNGNHSLSFSDVHLIIFKLKGRTYSIDINGKKLPEVKVNFNFDSISKIKILKCFYGQIFSVIIIKENLSSSQKTIIEINKNNLDEKTEYKINNLENDKDIKTEDDSVACTGNMFNNNDLINYNKFFKKGNKKLNEIEYLGGFECFIPLFKIVKFFISKLKTSDFLKNKIEDNNDYNNDYISKIIKYIIDILKIIIKLIYLSENNYNNFIKIIVPLIGSLAEIIESLNDLINSHFIEDKLMTNFMSNEIFNILFIIILNSELPFNIINSCYSLFEIKKDLDINNFAKILIIIELKKDINFIKWYFSLLLNYILFSLNYYDSFEKVPKLLIDKLYDIILYLSGNFKKNDISDFVTGVIAIKSFIDKFYLGKFDKINEIFNNLFIVNDYYFRYIINMIKITLNVKNISKICGINYKDNSFIKTIYLNLNGKSFFNNKNLAKMGIEKKKEIKNAFKYYRGDFDFLNRIFPFLAIEDIVQNDEFLIHELINYHKLYHHLMKELFVFNRLWSKKKLFYGDSLNERDGSNLKYKNINYYTTNFQRPIIYPILDYQYRYPKFSHYKCKGKEILYYIEERKDDYNFDLDCPNLDQIIEKYNNKIFEEIEKEENNDVYKICQIKQKYHIKGKLFVINTKDKFILNFCSHFYDLNNKNDNLITCNNPKLKNNKNLCYGSIFECQDNEKNKKIIININDIRMILKRIYFYRKSGLEIFTDTKSYYFNFYSEDDLDNFFYNLNTYAKDSKLFFPININKKELGYIKINNKFLSKISDNDLQNFRNDFIEFISYISKEDLYNLCVFDIITIINIISNRSYLDLYQYPVFPLLFFYNNGIKIDRDIQKHIGFQNQTDKSQKRLELFNKSLNDKDPNEINEDFHIFRTHYSNIVYTCSYMIRLFPYSFLSIELQGDGFDDPNRLFHSIETTFFNISFQKSDLRELIPEFFYLPEMLINISHLYFKDNFKKELVDSVIMPKELFNKKLKKIQMKKNI